MVEIVEIPGNKIEVISGNRVIRMPADHRIYADFDLAGRNLFDAFADSMELKQEGSRMVLDCSEPTLRRYIDGLEFYLSGLPEESSAIDDYLRRFVWTPNSLIFDLGAYCGVSSYHFAQRSDHVVALEPDPVNFHCLLANASKHRLANVLCVNAAVAKESGFEHFNSEGALGSSLVRMQPDRNLRGRVLVRTFTLQELVTKYGEPSLVKMDIEGTELEVLDSSRELLMTLKNTQFVLDTCHYVDGVYTCDRVEKIFRECGYLAESSNGRLPCTWAWRE